MRTYRAYRRKHPMLKMDVVRDRHEKRMTAYRKIGRWLRMHKYALLVETLVLMVTGLMIRIAYLERGYFAVGGECLIPGLAFLLYLADREVRKEFEDDDSN